MTYRQLNADGAGPITCQVSAEGTECFDTMQLTVNVPGKNGRSSVADINFVSPPVDCDMTGATSPVQKTYIPNSLLWPKCRAALPAQEPSAMQQMLALSSARTLLARLGAMLLSRQQTRQTNVVSWCEGRRVYGDECLVDMCVPPGRCRFEMARGCHSPAAYAAMAIWQVVLHKIRGSLGVAIACKAHQEKKDMKPSQHMYTT